MEVPVEAVEPTYKHPEVFHRAAVPVTTTAIAMEAAAGPSEEQVETLQPVETVP